MLVIRKKAYSRVGLMGNPSDGYGGKTISLILKNFAADVVLYEWEDLEILGSLEDQCRFESMNDLVEDVKLHGYYGGIRLVKATIKKFAEYCERHQIAVHDRNFSIRYDSDIPRQVGLGGSSAIIVATLRCLMEFSGVSIPLEVQPSLALSVETEELGIVAGLQDRAIQVYEGLLYMDFSEESTRDMEGFSCGRYAPLEVGKLPFVYVAYSELAGEPTEVFHNDVRERFDRGEPSVVSAMREFSRFTDEAKEALDSGDGVMFGKLMDQNFDKRKEICQLPRGQVDMIEAARSCGATAKFAGSGGAIVGTYQDADAFLAIQNCLNELGCRVIQVKT